jgi:hypothetical protein
MPDYKEPVISIPLLVYPILTVLKIPISDHGESFGIKQVAFLISISISQQPALQGERDYKPHH